MWHYCYHLVAPLINVLSTRQKEKVKYMRHYYYHLVAPLILILCTSRRKANLSGYILEFQNIYFLLNISLIKELLLKSWKNSRLLAIYFSLTWFSTIIVYHYCQPLLSTIVVNHYCQSLLLIIIVNHYCQHVKQEPSKFVYTTRVLHFM